MRTKRVLRVATATGAVGMFALFGTPTAAADYVGQSYADASAAMDESGLEPIVATRVGDKLEQDDCIVTAAWTPSFLRGVGDDFEPSEGEMMVALNCAGAYASETNPGASVQHPLGRAAKSEAEKEADDAAVVTPDE
ncbi:hypothetical protein [Mycolicibacterium pulveris]|uniref:hypothetical protein n=1 Tax=Mycolicibacterium pulveris TaxID=36813 RepID=UPI003CEDA09F